MRTVVIIHPAFPGQFGPYLDNLPDDVTVYGFGTTSYTSKSPRVFYSCVPYAPGRTPAQQARATLRAVQSLPELPDVILAHPMAGDTLLLRQFLPSVPQVLYCEGLYVEPNTENKLTHNMCMRSALDDMDLGISPTYAQIATYPESYRKRMTVVPEFLNMDYTFLPNNAVCLARRNYPEGTPLILYAAGNLEPNRLYGEFLAAMRVLRDRIPIHVIVLGNKMHRYDDPPADAAYQTYHDHFLPDGDPSWLTYVNTVKRDTYLSMIESADLCVNLSRNHTPSWSLRDMCCLGKRLVTNDTAANTEVLYQYWPTHTGRGFPVSRSAFVCDAIPSPADLARTCLQALQSEPTTGYTPDSGAAYRSYWKRVLSADLYPGRG